MWGILYFPASWPSWSRISKWGNIVIQYWDLTAGRSPNVKYGESRNFRLVVHHSWEHAVETFSYVKYGDSPRCYLVGHLWPRFQDEAMYINGPLQTLFVSMHVHLKSFTPENLLWKVFHVWYGDSPKCQLVSHLCPRFQDEAMYINEP